MYPLQLPRTFKNEVNVIIKSQTKLVCTIMTHQYQLQSQTFTPQSQMSDNPGPQHLVMVRMQTQLNLHLTLGDSPPDFSSSKPETMTTSEL